VFVDKVGTTTSLVPLYAWSPEGERAFCRAPRSWERGGGLWVEKCPRTFTYEHMTRDNSVEMTRRCEVEESGEGVAAHACTTAERSALSDM
jgi:hypothetical protein